MVRIIGQLAVLCILIVSTAACNLIKVKAVRQEIEVDGKKYLLSAPKAEINATYPDGTQVPPIKPEVLEQITVTWREENTVRVPYMECALLDWGSTAFAIGVGKGLIKEANPIPFWITVPLSFYFAHQVKKKVDECTADPIHCDQRYVESARKAAFVRCGVAAHNIALGLYVLAH